MKVQYATFLYLALLVTACGILPPKPTTVDESFSAAYSGITSAYHDIIALKTPTVEGAEPLLSDERAAPLIATLDRALAALDIAHDAWLAGKPYDGEAVSQVSAILRNVRAALPRAT